MEAYRLYTVVPYLVKFVDSLTNIYVRYNRRRLKVGAAGGLGGGGRGMGMWARAVDGWVGGWSAWGLAPMRCWGLPARHAAKPAAATDTQHPRTHTPPPPQGGKGGEDCRYALASLYWVLLDVAKVMAPFTPFLTEAMYQNLRKCLPEGSAPESVHFCDFPETVAEQQGGCCWGGGSRAGAAEPELAVGAAAACLSWSQATACACMHACGTRPATAPP
jgi:hypothetical protein